MWQENLSGSSRHVHERAVLPIAAIELIGITDNNLVKFQFKSSSGKRNYDGWASTGQTVLSSSDVDMRGVQAEYQWKLSPDLSWGFRVEHELFSRRLNGVSDIKGYLEDYTGFSLLIGGTKKIQFSLGNTLDLAAWYGGGEGHKMKLMLDPYDSSTVKLGSTRKADITATWKSPLERTERSQWDFIGQLSFTKSETGQSEVGDLKNHGVSVGTFIQPGIECSGWRVMMGIAHTW